MDRVVGPKTCYDYFLDTNNFVASTTAGCTGPVNELRVGDDLRATAVTDPADSNTYQDVNGQVMFVRAWQAIDPA
jgi:hypothetical protein